MDDGLREAVRDRLLAALRDADLRADEAGEDRWMTMLSGEWKRTIPVLLDLQERHLHVTSLLCAAPDEGRAEVYEILLHRNEDPAPVHFALDDEGDVILTGAVPLEALDARGIDELLGAVLVISDEVSS